LESGSFFLDTVRDALSLNGETRRFGPSYLTRTTMQQFDHEKLNVYQTAITFVAWSSGLLKNVPKSIAVHNQLDRASTSIALNIAEGNGKHTSADRCRFFDTARGSTLECAACLDVLVAKGIVEESMTVSGKEMLLKIVSMLVGLIRSNSQTRDV
jgi:four helix bundle protein